MTLDEKERRTNASTTHKNDVHHGCLAVRWGKGFWYTGKLARTPLKRRCGVSLLPMKGTDTDSDIKPNAWPISWIGAKGSGIYGDSGGRCR